MFNRKRKAPTKQDRPTGVRGSAWWVRWFLAVGRPAVVLLGLAVLAPAERHLAEVAGYDHRVCWGVAVIVSAYGGMAALTAAYVDRDHPDRQTAVVGALGAVLAGSLSQVFAHLIATGYIGVLPRPPIALVILPSVAPVAIVGHLLHLSWVKVGDAPAEAPRGPVEAPEPPAVPVPVLEAPEPVEAPWAELLTYEEVASLTGRADSTVRGWVHSGKVEPVMRAGRPHIRRSDIPVAVATAKQPELEAAVA